MSDLATVELEFGWDDQAEELALLSGAKLGWPRSVSWWSVPRLVAWLAAMMWEGQNLLPLVMNSSRCFEMMMETELHYLLRRLLT